jgi:hypothetical protein
MYYSSILRMFHNNLLHHIFLLYLLTQPGVSVHTAVGI